MQRHELYEQVLKNNLPYNIIIEQGQDIFKSYRLLATTKKHWLIPFINYPDKCKACIVILKKDNTGYKIKDIII